MLKRATLGVYVLAVIVGCMLPAAKADAASYAVYGNNYVQVWVGTSGKFEFSDGGEQDVSGRWAMVSQQGDPETPGDDNRNIIYAPAGNCAYWMLKIDNTYQFVGDSTAGTWYKDPNDDPIEPRTFGVVQEYPSAYGTGHGAAGGFILGTWRTSVATGGAIDLNIKISLVRDQARFEFAITNRSNKPHSVGFGMKGDVEVSDTVFSGFPFIPGVGYVRTGGSMSPFTPMLFGFPNYPKVPDYFEIYDDIEKPALVTRNILNQEDAVKPDYAAIGSYLDLSPTSVWLADRTTYSLNSMVPVNDLYWALCWNSQSLGAGATRKIVTYYGLGAASTKATFKSGSQTLQDSVALAVQGPRSLKYDSTQPTILNPSPFTVSAYVYNLAVGYDGYDLQDATATIFLPPGLDLAPGETASKDIGPVPRNSEALPVTWDVVANGDYSGELEYSVSASDIDSGWSQTTTRKVLVPADKVRTFDYGWQLVSVPFAFDDPSVEHIFGLLPGTFAWKYYDPLRSPNTGSYYSDTPVPPGGAFWMRIGALTTYGDALALPLAGDASIVGESLGKQVKEQRVTVRRGWNMIGNPFVYPVYWGQVLVSDDAAIPPKTYTLDYAVSKGWFSRTLFAWNPKKFAYDYVLSNDQMLMPFQGYWLYVGARSSKTLIFRPSIFPASDVTALVGGG